MAPAYHTRARDNIHIRPTIQTFHNAFQLLRLPTSTPSIPHIPNKRKCLSSSQSNYLDQQQSVQITHKWQPELWEMWSHRDDGTHALWVPPLCAAPMDQARWCHHQISKLHLNRICPQSLILSAQHYLQRPTPVPDHSYPRQVLTQYASNTDPRNKRDIIYRRLNLPPSANQITDPSRLAAHLNSTLQRLHSYLEYIGLAKYSKAIKMLHWMMEINLENFWLCHNGTTP